MCVAIGLLVRASAHAESVNGCIDTCTDTYNSDQWELQQNCMNQCQNHVNYGAIAYAPGDGSYGYSYDYHSENEADRHALANCSDEGNGCQVVITFWETCAALAAGDNNRYAASLGDGAGDASGKALAACARKGGRNCDVKVSTCARD